MKLLGSGGSPYARKVRIAFAEKGIPYDYLMVRATSAEVAAANPLAQVPVLIRDDGTSLYDSAVIVEYVDGLTASPRLIPTAFADRIEVRRWEALGDGIMDATVAISHDERLPVAERKPAEWYKRRQMKIDAGLAVMERDLDSRAFCFGAGFTLADVACGTALGYLDHALPRVEWRHAHPGLRRHAAALAARASFKSTLPIQT